MSNSMVTGFSDTDVRGALMPGCSRLWVYTGCSDESKSQLLQFMSMRTLLKYTY